jgi:serine/threonine protein kinase/Tfp pilus assembly protein PilF
MALAAGSQLGRYQILALIGEGGMGEVYRARDPSLGRDVAIKVSAERFSDRFERETQAIAALAHPHICQVYDVGPNYLVMELVAGEPLKGPLPVERALALGVQIASALEEAHRKGIIHRDLKPANILVTPTGVKLLDFGLAKREQTAGTEDTLTKTQAGTVLGTAAYMSPEQASGKPADARSDIFSFGAVLYEMLSGQKAFQGETALTVLGAILNRDPRPLRDLAPQVSDVLAQVVARCLRKDPARRFQTAAELKAAIEEAKGAKHGAETPSIAVLPFVNMSSSKDDEYFSDGLAEEILNVLTHIPGLKVAARTSSFAFRGREQDIVVIADKLGVRTILEGSIRRAGSRIRVTAQLINAADGFHLWSERYDRELTDVFAVQDEIAAAITEALQVKLSAKPTPLQRHTPSLPAYESYLKAQYHRWRTTQSDLAIAKEFFEQAIALDPEFALAYAGYADLFGFLAGSGLRPAREMMPIMRQNAQKALELDASLPEAHAMLGIVAGHLDYDWNEALRQFQLAMAHDPMPPSVRMWYGFFYLIYVGRTQESVEQLQLALQEDPLNALFRSCLAVSLTLAGQPAQAEQEARRALEADPQSLLALLTLGPLCARRGNFKEALAFAERSLALQTWSKWSLGLMAAVLEKTGEVSRSQSLLETLRSSSEYGAPVALATYHASRGEIDAVVECLEKAAESRYLVAWNFLGVSLSILQSSPRWALLASTMNLPPAVSGEAA